MDNNVSAILDNYRNQINSVLNRPNSLDAILRRGAVADQLAYGAPTGGVEIPEFDGMPLAMGGQPVGAQGLQDLMTMVSHAGSGILGDETTPPNWGQIYGQRAQQQIEEQKMLDAREIAKTDAINKAVSENKAIKAQMAQKGVDAILKEADLEIEQDQIKSSLMSTLFTGEIEGEKINVDVYKALQTAAGEGDKMAKAMLSYANSTIPDPIKRNEVLQWSYQEAQSRGYKPGVMTYEDYTALMEEGKAALGYEEKDLRLPKPSLEEEVEKAGLKAGAETTARLRAEAEATGEPYVIKTPGGRTILASPRPGGKPTSLQTVEEAPGNMPVALQEKAQAVMEGREISTELSAGFRSEFTGKNIPGQVVAKVDQSTGITKYIGGSKDANLWWYRYNQWVTDWRHDKFGASLTDSEQAAFDKLIIHPGMDADLVKSYLKKQQEIAEKRLRRAASMIEGGRYQEGQEKAISGELDEISGPEEFTGSEESRERLIRQLRDRRRGNP